MPRLSRLLHSGRFFARLDRFVCECPRCTTLIHAHFDLPVGNIRSKQRARRRPSRAKTMTYNPFSSRLTCPMCRKTWGVGLLLYPVHRRSPSAQPADQKPTYHQLLQLRQYAGGFLAERVLKGADEVNVAMTADCTCPQEAGGIDMGCPIHGWDESNRRMRETGTVGEAEAKAKTEPDDPT